MAAASALVGPGFWSLDHRLYGWKRNLTVAFRETACYVNRVLYVPYARISVVSRIEAKAVLPVAVGGNVQIDARLLPPVQVWSEREVTLFRQFIAVLANVGVHPEQFLQDDNGRSRYCLRPREAANGPSRPSMVM